MDLRDLMPWNWPRGAAFGSEPASDPLRSLQADINRAFESFRQSVPSPTFHANWGMAFDKLEPRIDVIESENELEIVAELPGLEETDIEVGLNDDSVTIKGEKRQGREAAGCSYRINERTFGLIQRSVRLPAAVDQDDVKATFRNGVLTITLRKTGEPDADKKRIFITKA